VKKGTFNVKVMEACPFMVDRLEPSK
jgi:hypothetical protein